MTRQSGGTAKSTATLSSDGKVLHGKTTQSYSTPQEQEQRTASVSYDWVATKFAAPAKVGL